MNYLQTGLANARQELKSPMFDRTEPSRSDNLLSETDSTPSIDITKTFSSKPHYITIPLKLFLLTWVLAMLGVSISSYEYPSFWLAYLTNWGWTFTCAYFVFSLGTALCLMRFGEEGKASDVFVKVTWVSSFNVQNFCAQYYYLLTLINAIRCRHCLRSYCQLK